MVAKGALRGSPRGWVSEPHAQKYGDLTSVDLSYNGITVLDSLEGFTKLESLVVDSNCLEAKQDRLPRIPTLTTLCVNDNNIVDIDEWLNCVATCFPSLTYLSMLKNPACPNYFIGKDQQDYARYRLFVLHRLPGLKFLDSSPVTAQVTWLLSRATTYHRERRNARKLSAWDT
jgi:hypothetical protein